MLFDGRGRDYKKILFTLLTVGVLVFGFWIRIHYHIANPPEGPPKEPLGDDWFYHNLALNLINGNGYSASPEPPYTPIAYRTPTYPLFLAGIYLFFGAHPLWVILFQAILDTMTCFIISRTIYGISSDKRASFFALFGSVLFLPTRFYVGSLMSEVLGAFLLALVCHIWISTLGDADIKERKRNTLMMIILAFFTIALIYCRPTYGLIPLVVVGVLRIRKKNVFWKNAAVFLTMCAVFASPWVIRNKIIFGEWIFTATRTAGYALWVGSWQRTPQLWKDEITIDEGEVRFPPHAFLSAEDEEKLFGTRLKETEAGSVYRSVAVKNIANEPREWFKRRLFLLPYLCDQWFILTPRLRWLNSVPKWGIPILACLGALFFRREIKIYPWLLFVLYTAAVQFPFLMETRYALPAYPAVFGLASAALFVIYEYSANFIKKKIRVKPF